MWQGQFRASPLQPSIPSREVARKATADIMILTEQLLDSDAVTTLGRWPVAKSHAMAAARPRPRGANFASDMR